MVETTKFSVTGGDWSLGVLIGTPITLLILVAMGVMLVLVLRWRAEEVAKRGRDRYYTDDTNIATGVSVVISLLMATVIGLLVWGCYPFSAEYHQWRTTTGTVVHIDSRLLADSDGGTTQRFVVDFGGGNYRSCDDTRCSTVKVGDVLTLSCKRHWQFTGTDGYDCNWIGVKKP